MSWAGWEWEIVQTSTESAKGEVRETTVGHPLRDSSDGGCHCDTSIAAGTAPFPPVPPQQALYGSPAAFPGTL